MEVNLQQSLLSIKDSSHVVKSSGTTHVNLTKVQYTWTISNFSCCKTKIGESVFSPKFQAGANNEYKWQLKCFPYGDEEESKGSLSLYLYFIPDIKPDVEAKYRFYILNANKKESMATAFTLHQFNKLCRGNGYPKFMNRSLVRDAANSLLPNDSLTIVCDLIIIESIVHNAEESNSETFDVPECRLLADLSELFESPKLCDVTLITCGQEFQAHKGILAARSPVFSAMFQHDMLEQQENRVTITDVDDVVLREILRFIYTGKITNLDKMADGLLAAAEKYELERLKCMCEKALSKSIAIENAASRLIAGDLYGAAYLKERAQDFICTHTEEVLKTASYKSMHNTHPHLIDEAFQALATKKLSQRLREVYIPK